MNIIKTFMQTIRGKNKTENVRTSDYIVGDYTKSARTAAESQLIKIHCTSCYMICQTHGRLPQNFLK